MRALRVLIVAAAVLWPKSAVAYTIVTQLFYNAPTATLAGYRGSL